MLSAHGCETAWAHLHTALPRPAELNTQATANVSCAAPYALCCNSIAVLENKCISKHALFLPFLLQPSCVREESGMLEAVADRKQVCDNAH